MPSNPFRPSVAACTFALVLLVIAGVAIAYSSKRENRQVKESSSVGEEGGSPTETVAGGDPDKQRKTLDCSIVPEHLGAGGNLENVADNQNLEVNTQKAGGIAGDGGLISLGSSSNHKREKLRVIVTTDGERDDKNSFSRFLLYVNDFDVEGLVYTNSVWHPKGNGTTWMRDQIDEYAKVFNNLRKHDPEYPTPASLKAVLKVGNLEEFGIEAVGAGKDTPGSDHIVSLLLDDDPRPLWVHAWGGVNNIAQALYRLRESHPKQLDAALDKIRIYAIASQDDIWQWIGCNFPTAQFIQNNHQFWRVIAYDHDRKNPVQNHPVFGSRWLRENITTGHGPLSAQYFSDVQEEGDSPAFFHMINTGLRSAESPDFGGWGGRFAREQNNYWTDTSDDYPGDSELALDKPLWRWIVQISLDWQARADWALKSFEEANHHPIVNLGHAQDLTVSPGEQVSLIAKATDPDGDGLTYEWWRYYEADSYDGKVKIRDASSAQASFVAPDARGQDLHLIVTVTDNGNPPLQRYRRVIVSIR
ncbi:MAG: DUF1593 domain-containing protein [Symploca sp. SIO2E6]|nr:DUF1593 domain-containing protein [Symploca sp. SIO2E6]